MPWLRENKYFSLPVGGSFPRVSLESTVPTVKVPPTIPGKIGPLKPNAYVVFQSVHGGQTFVYNSWSGGVSGQSSSPWQGTLILGDFQRFALASPNPNFPNPNFP